MRKVENPIEIAEHWMHLWSTCYDMIASEPGAPKDGKNMYIQKLRAVNVLVLIILIASF